MFKSESYFKTKNDGEKSWPPSTGKSLNGEGLRKDMITSAFLNDM
ncbi:MAG TPA: hypothetical protein PLK11_04180 [Methanofastidiosum sp.]|nr:hypothetical protein [Methanofastidiosum sp.]HOR88384.1 hypothetical protein [Methanofastidiosum sp.]HPL00527.1 hypothetical protein [Methanofastidiosum sp.]